MSLGVLPNILKLFSRTGEVDVQKTHDFIELSRAELADVLNVSPDQIRPSRISPKVKTRVGELAGALELVAFLFDGDVNKTKYWLKTPNPHLGGTCPRELILRGRYKRVIDFIQDAYSRRSK